MLPLLRANVSTHSVARLLIVSYLVALSLNLIDGAKLSYLFAPFLDDAPARLIAQVLVISLSGMVLLGVGRRVAALLLSLVLFWASYLTMYMGNDLGAFWRDLALIGGLLLTVDLKGPATVDSSADLPREETGDDDVLGGARSRARVISRTVFRNDLELSRND